MPDTIVFLGAGATKSCNGPLTDEILPAIHGYAAEAGAGAGMARLRQFLEQEFHVSVGAPKAHYPGLPLLLSLVDVALDLRQDFNERWDLSALADLRQQIEFGIWEVLEEKLERAPTNNHFQLFDRLYPSGGEEPCVISTNYDLIADTTLMFFSSARSGEERLPGYRCAIKTFPEPHTFATFGTLLKLHGSLNWAYCKTCRRMQLGASSGKLYLKVMERLAGQDLSSMFTPDGEPCPTCATRLRPLLLAPSHMKDYRNPHLTQVWYEAERVLREAKRVVFVGYSLPEDDVEVIYLLKRSLSRADVSITVIDYDGDPEVAAVDHPVGRRFRTLFGDRAEWCARGLDGWLAAGP